MNIEEIIRKIIRDELELVVELLPSDKELPELMEVQDVLDYTKIARSTLYLMIDKGTFPRPLNIGERRIAWKKEDIKEWIESK